MPANRSRTHNWRRCLEQIHGRGGSIEIAVDGAVTGGDEGSHLVWRVRVLDLKADEIVVESPVALGRLIHLEAGVRLVAVMTVGQNRWLFHTVNRGAGGGGGGNRPVPSLRLAMPTDVERCQRRHHERVAPEPLRLPEVELWPLLDPKSVVVCERANELRFAAGGEVAHDQDDQDDRGDGAPFASAGDELLPEVGPRFTARLVNLGGGGVGLRVAPDHGQILSRHKLFWLRFSLEPDLPVPVCASAKLVHSHMQSDQHLYAGLAFDFSFNAGHQRIVAEQIANYVALRQRLQAAEMRKSA